MSDDTKSTVTGIVKTAASFALGVVAAAFFLGGREAKINDVAQWKQETAPRIERMDNIGSHSFEYFQKEYEKTQSRQEKKLEELEKDIRELQRKTP
jgi:hypothetical protein